MYGEYLKHLISSLSSLAFDGLYNVQCCMTLVLEVIKEIATTNVL